MLFTTGVTLSNGKNCIPFEKKESYATFWQKITLITSKKYIESSVMPIETKKFLEEETIIEALNNAPTIYDDNSEEDLLH